MDAAEHDQVGFFAFDLGQDRLEVGVLVRGVLARNQLDAQRFCGGFEVIGETLAVGRAVVDYRDRFALQRFCCKTRER
ncbi:MAG: hypothetical protein AN484_27630, partial [Aphanizomenon flos-aquae WA102]